MALTQTMRRAGLATQQLIVFPGAVGIAVTQLVSMQAGGGLSTPEQPQTQLVLASRFILVLQAVEHPVAPGEHWQTVAVFTGAVVVTVGAGLIDCQRS